MLIPRLGDESRLRSRLSPAGPHASCLMPWPHFDLPGQNLTITGLPWRRVRAGELPKSRSYALHVVGCGSAS